MSKIAWIEDDYPEIYALVSVLERKGHSVPRYRVYKDVMEHLQEICNCEAVILDIILPTEDNNPYQGIKVLKTLRENCERNIPVVVCTVVRNQVVLDSLEELGVSAILHKPVRPSKLAEAVLKAIEDNKNEA